MIDEGENKSVSKAAGDKVLNTRLIHVYMQLAADLGIDRNKLVACSDIDPIWLARTDLEVPVAVLYKLAANMAKMAGTEDIGLLAGRACFLNQGGLISHLSGLSSHLRQWLNMMPSSLQAVGDIGETGIGREGELLHTQWLATTPAAQSGRYIADMMLSMSQSLLSGVCYKPVPIVKVYFDYPEPAETSLHQQIFAAELVFDQAFSGLFFPFEALAYPVVKVWDDSTSIKQEYLSGIVGKSSEDGFMRRLKRCIVRALPTGAMTIDSIASELAISRRTLQRRLSDRDEVFANVVQQLRSSMALHFLIDQKTPIIEIAFLLGYADTSSFSTAFKGWHGCSPTEYLLKVR